MARDTYEAGRDVHRALIGKPEEKRALGRPKHKWEDLKM